MLKRGLFFCVAVWICSCWVAAADAKIIKVLPHLLDLEGRHTLSPSLYERDAYQNHLRRHPGERSALRFDVQWKTKGSQSSNLFLRLELRTSESALGKPLALERPVRRARWFSTWSALTIQGEAFRQMGDLIAWRATLREGEQTIAELRSFLW